MEKFKRHPKFQYLEISAEGEFLLDKKPLRVIDRDYGNGKTLKQVYINRTYYSAPKLLLEAWVEKPDSNKRYYAMYREGKTLKLDNLYWSSLHISPEAKFKADCRKSKVSKDQMYNALASTMFKRKSKEAIARELGVSAMSVARAINRLEKKVSKLSS